MPTVFSHAVVGAAAASLYRWSKTPERRTVVACAFLAVLPDWDGLFFGRIPYGQLFGHRGITHSLLFAAVCGAGTAWLLKRAAFWPHAVLFAAVTASHGLLDACTDGGLGVALFAPFDATRYFFPHRPIPVSPMSLGTLLTARGVRVASGELLLLWSFAASIWLWNRGTAWRRSTAIICVLTGLWAWNR